MTSALSALRMTCPLAQCTLPVFCMEALQVHILQCNQSLGIMVSKIVLLFFFGQILLAILFFYLLPISSANEYQKISGKIEKSSKPIINLKQGELLFSILKCWRENLFCSVFSWVKRVKKSTQFNFSSQNLNI